MLSLLLLVSSVVLPPADVMASVRTLELPHVPHDNAHGVATAHLPGGVVETIIATQRECKVLRTRDEGLSWEPVRGAGLELGRADLVIWDGHPSGQRFLIAADEGIWSYDPMTDSVQAYVAGLPTDELGRWACKFSAPGHGGVGPVFLANKAGQIWRLNRANDTWELSLDTGLSDERAQIAVMPTFDETSPSGPEQCVAAAVQGVLYVSQDGGVNWSINANFSTPSGAPNEPLITALEFAHDYPSSGGLVLATSVEDHSTFTKDRGTIWKSIDFGATFTPVYQCDSSVRVIQSTPTGPSGQQWYLASVLEHPSLVGLANSTGILRSSDLGATWRDFGSRQDFILEFDSSFTIGHGREKIHDFEVSADFATSGELQYCRSEGLYYSRDEGENWKRRSFRPTAQVRGLDCFLNSKGELIGAAGSYGSGTWFHNSVTAETTILRDGASTYLDEISLSPRFTEDGMMLVGGSRGLAMWFDPVLNAPNPHNVYGWKTFPMTAQLGYVRAFAFSPNFDGRGTPGSDQVFLFSTSSASQSNYLTTDGGLSFKKLDTLVGGGPAPFMRHLAIAPTFSVGNPTGPLDVYAARGSNLFRLNGMEWELMHTFSTMITSLSVATDFDRNPSTPGLPRLFLSTLKSPYFLEVLDEPTGMVITERNDGLGDAAVVKVACPPDFGTSQTLYLATFSSGIRKLDLSQPNPTWVEVGQNFPNQWLTTLVLSPDFANDRKILAGSQGGLIVGADLPGVDWELQPPPLLRDSEAAEFQYYQPNRPGVPDGNRTWPWESVFIQPYQSSNPNLGVEFVDVYVEYTGHDGSYVECNEYAGGITVHTFRGPTMGNIRVEVENYWTGAPVASTTLDLHAPSIQDKKIKLDFPYQAVRIQVTADLGPGETLAFDGMTFWDR